jgi:hypothetical protein
MNKNPTTEARKTAEQQRITAVDDTFSSERTSESKLQLPPNR